MLNLDKKILFVCSGNSNQIAPFILEQKSSLENHNYKVDLFTIKGKGVFGYMSNYLRFLKQIKNQEYDIIHAHYGLSGFFSILQFYSQVVITFHGSDLNNFHHRIISNIASFFSRKNIVVSNSLKNKLIHKNAELIPCGVDLDVFYPLNKEKARKILEKETTLKFCKDFRYILFSSSFSRKVKNYPLAKDSILLMGQKYKLIELAGFSRSQTNLLFNSVDAALMTSFTEGSPQFIKEAMATECPIVSVNLNEVMNLLYKVNNTRICNYDKFNIAEAIRDLVEKNNIQESNSRSLLKDRGYELKSITKKIIKYCYEK